MTGQCARMRDFEMLIPKWNIFIPHHHLKAQGSLMMRRQIVCKSYRECMSSRKQGHLNKTGWIYT